MTDLKNLIHDVADFPIKGVGFKDISPLLRSPEAMNTAVEGLARIGNIDQIDAIVGIESRGFILGAAMAAKFRKGFIPLRKAGKLPPPVHSLSYSLEYGEATLEMKSGKGKVLLVDDVLATGGTLSAGILLCEKAGYELVSVAVLISLSYLNGMEFRGREVPSLIRY